ncbi:MAG TPA: SNF2 helicase associated domain-containing protein, partial [Clostridia bacterium]
MFEIDERFMMEIASTRDVYNKGRLLANSVENISVNSKKVSGVVKSKHEYNVNVEFKGASTLKNYECECDDYYTEPGACKHVVALLEAVRRDSMNKTRPEGIRNSYISFSTVESINPKKNCLNLYIEQVFMQDRGRYSLVMSFKIGKTRPYVVKNIISLLDSIRDEKTVYFGKNLTVDFKTEGFADKAEIIDFLCEILKRERELKNNAYYYSYMPSSNVFVNDDVVLYGDNLRNYLALTKNMGIITDCGGVIDKLKVIDDIPLEINLREEDGIIVMEADYGRDRKILPLTEDCSVVLAPKNVEAYLIPKEKRNLVKAVYNARLQKKMPVFSIDKDEQNGFIRQYLPRLKKTNEVKCSESLSEKLSKTHLVPRVYFDSAEGGIFARVDFCYGSNVIVYGDNENDSGLISRDTDYEKRVIEFLEDAGMKFKEKRFSTWDEEIIVQILTSKAELLREFCEVYYSEAFKSLNVRSVGRVNMGVRLNSESLLEFDFNVDGVGDDELSQIIMSVREKKKYYKLKNGNILNIENKELVNISNLLDDLDIDERKVKSGNVKLASSKALYIDNFIRENEISNVSVNENFERLISDIVNPPD